MAEQQHISTYEAYSGTPFIPQSVYDALPVALSEPANHYANISQRARDMMLLSSIVAIGSALKNVYFGWAGKKNHTSLYLLLSAPPSSFKSVMSDAKGYVREVTKYYKDRYQTAVQDWQMRHLAAKENKEAFHEPMPFAHWFIIPAKITKPALLSCLNACPVNLQISHESSSIFQSFNGGEHSDYRDILLNSWNEEAINEQTKSGGRIEVESPRLGIITSTTPEQTFKLTGTGCDGLLSRFMAYVSAEQTPFLNLATHPECKEELTNAYNIAAKYSGEILNKSLWSDCEVRMNLKQYSEFAPMLNAICNRWQAGNPDAEAYRSIIVRTGIMMLRIASIITVLAEKREQRLVYIQDSVWHCTKAIVHVLLEHMYRVMVVESSRAPKELVVPKPVVTEESQYAKFQRLLPKEFTRTDAYNIAAELNISVNSVNSYLNRMKQRGILKLENKIFTML
jgi:hypothetical protein